MRNYLSALSSNCLLVIFLLCSNFKGSIYYTLSVVTNFFKQIAHSKYNNLLTTY